MRGVGVYTSSVCAGLVLFCGVPPAFSGEKPARQLVTDANKALAGGDHVKALHLYEQAEKQLPDSPEIAYNQGVARYREGDYEKAAERFIKALATRDSSLDARARFNLGNCAYTTALRKQSDLKAGIAKLQEAIRYYREVLDVAPDDRDAKVNIEMAQLLIKDLLDKEKQRQEEEKKKKEQDKQDKKDQATQPSQQQSCSQPASAPESQPQQSQQEQQKQDQQKSGEPKQAQEQKAQGQEGEKKEAQQGKLESDNEKKDGQEQQAQMAPATRRAMTPEEAERLLQMIRDKEQQRREEQARQIRTRLAPVERDW